MEIFKDIVGYEGLYQVSNMGRVKSLSREVCSYQACWMSKDKIKKPCNGVNGYLQVTLNSNGKRRTRTIHQLVAVAFLNHTPCGHKLVIDHINNDKLDNRVENLQIVTTRFNSRKTQVNYSSQYKGVHWCKRSNKWRSEITINKKKIFLGYFEKEYDASVVYQNKLLSLNN